MKKFLIIFFIFFLSLNSLDVNAATFDDDYVSYFKERFLEGELEFDKVTDEQGHILTGYFLYVYYVEERDIFYYGYNIIPNPSSTSEYIYLVRTPSTIDDGFVQSYEYRIFSSSDDSSFVVNRNGNNYCYYDDFYNYSYSIPMDRNIPDVHYSHDILLCNLPESCVGTSFPVFDYGDQDAIDAYVNSGDYSGAVNADDVDRENSVVDGDIEMPRDLKVTKGYATGLVSAYSLDKDCVFTWNQTVDTSGYVYDVDAQMVIGTVTHSGSAVLTGDKYDSGWVNIVDSYHYDGAQQMTRSITASQLNDILLVKCFDNYIAATNKKLTYKGYLVSQLKIRVRNRSGTSASDYVVITIDMDSASTTAKVEDENGEDVENDEYTGQDVSDPDKPSVTDSDLSLTGILDYIRSGFGLLGSGGLLSLMSSTFSYIPSSVWTLIKTAIAISITIMVLSLVKRFVFG